MKGLKRVIAIMLSVLILCGAVPSNITDWFKLPDFSMKASAASTLKYGNENGITRAEWLYDLTVVFDMFAEEEYLPDNYFSDLEESHKYYDAIINAVQYGVIDIPAGEELKPDEYVTRDFAASTLNFCLGYKPEEGKEYTFTDIDEVTSPDSSQIALNRGWFELLDGAFSPETLVTSSQVKTMLDDAAEVLEKQVIDTGYDNTYEFENDVIVLPEDVEATEDENGVVTITDCSETIAVNDKFAVYYNGIPVVYTAQSVTVNDNVTVIETEAVETEDAFTEVDAQGVIDSSAMEIVPAEDVEVSVDEGSGGISTFAIKKTKTLKAEKTIKSGGLTGKISVKIENPYIDYSTSSNGGYVTLNGETTVTYSISASLAQAAGLSKGFTLFTVNILGVGSFDVAIMVDFSGTASGTVKGFLTAGVQVEKDVGIRAIRGFLQHEAYTSVEAETKVSLKATLGVTKMPVISAYIYAEVGVKANFSKKTFADDKKPHQCTHFAAYLFAEYGASASAKIGWVSYEDSITNKIYTESNSPMRVVNHYEDGNLVAKCTRGTSYSNFFTKGNSRWSGCGWISANGAYGLNADGTYFALYDYELNENNEAIITKYNGNAWSVYIPKDIDGYTVVGIGSNAFQNKGVGYVVVPDTVIEIGNRAFSNCALLSNINLPSSLNSLGYDAFYNCDSLEKINIPKSLENAYYDSYYSPGVTYYTPFRDCDGLKTVEFEKGITSIIDNLFWQCTGLEEIEIPDTVTIIGSNAFRGCSSLKEVEIPNTVTEIGNRAFSNCALLSSINLSFSLNSLGYDAFYNCDSLEKINIPKSLENAYYDSYYSPGVTYYTPFRDCDGLKTVEFEKGITSIIGNLFWQCTGLEEIEIPDTVTIIGSNAFRGCSNLKEVEIPNTVTEIGNRAFSNCALLSSINLSFSLNSLGYDAFYNCDSLETINIPKSLENAYWDDYYAPAVTYYTPFRDCDGLKTVEFEKGITSIVDNLFWQCTGLEEIEIPDTVTIIGSNAFRGCSSLKEVIIPDTVAEIGNKAFYSCVSLISIKIPSAVTTINEYMFYNCEALKTIEIPNSIVSIEDYSFYGCSSLESVKLPDTLKDITPYLFNSCSSLKTIDFPKTVQTIQNSAFYGCTSLESISFSNGSTLKEIQSSAFYGCSSLKEVILPETTKSIGYNAFQNCSSLEKVTIPQSTKSLGGSTFMGCASLKEVSIADYSITKIESNTFKDCPTLQSIVLPKGLTVIGSQAFMNGTGLMSVTIPESVTSIDSTAFSYPLKTTIYGKTGSYAETFANNGGFTFKDISIPVEGIILKDGVENVTLDQGETYRAEFEVYPEDANDVITLTANNSNVTIDGHDIYARYSGDTVITATSTSGLTYEFTLHIRSVKNIAVVNDPNKTTYVLGEEFDKTGMSVQVNYYDGSSCIVEDYTISGFDSSVEGENTVTIKWVAANGSTYSTRLSLNIVDTRPKLTGIYIATPPTKVIYELREPLDTTGMVVKGIYTDNSRSVITDYTVSGYNALKKGVQTITVSYGEFSTTFTVTVGQDDHTHTYDNDCDTTCNVSGCTYTRVVSGHTYDKQVVADKYLKSAATCSSAAVYYKSCVCGAKGTTTFTNGSKLSHKSDSGTITKKATCTATGTKTYKCTLCKATIKTDTIAKVAHKYDSGKVTKAATCKATGVKTYTCSVCKGTKTETIAKLTTHTYSNNCDKSCNVCGKTRTVGAHKYSNACDTTCNYCNAKRTIKHTYSNSCDTTCNVCKAKRTIKHTYSNNCDTSCNVCKATRTITHTYKTTTTKATLTKNGSIVKKCTVCGKVASNTAIKYAKTFKLSTTAYTYNGGVKTPSVTVKDSAGKTLKKNTDYTVTYASGRKNAGTYKVTVKMIGKYSGTKTLTFKINPAKISSYKLSATSYTYDGKVKKPAVTVKNSSGTKLTTSSYTVTYASGRKNVGTYKVTIKGKGNYTGTKTLTFKINPAKTTVSKLTAGKKSITVAITKKSTQVTGYQIQYSTSKTFNKATTKTISSYKTTKYTLKSLSAKKTYYVRVRTYKKVGSTTYYSGWSAYKYIKTK